MRVVLTGSAGFLGWHTHVRSRFLAGHTVHPVDRSSWSQLAPLVRDADALIHVAGVNRGSSAEIEDGNIALARDVAGALESTAQPLTLVYANSIQSGNGSSYGSGKAQAGAILSGAARRAGHRYVDVRLPNLFGEHGRPHYNSFVATFVDAVINGERPPITDRPITLMHVQDAAQCLLDALIAPDESTIEPTGTPTTVGEVFDRLTYFSGSYRDADVPALVSDLDRDLFNTMRSGLVHTHYPVPLTNRSDHRGRLVETVRAHGPGGQTFVSTSHPGVTRGDHFHIRKVERFVVLSGRAKISMRRVLTNDALTFEVDGSNPSFVDMPTLWTHNIVNTGTGPLTTLFWTNELFDPARPDTIPHPVATPRVAGSTR